MLMASQLMIWVSENMSRLQPMQRNSGCMCKFAFAKAKTLHT